MCLKVPDVFIGYTDDTIASLVLKFSKLATQQNKDIDDIDDYEWED